MAAPMRPASITVIAWLAILYGILTLALKGYLLFSPEALAMSRDVFAKLNEGALLRLPFEAHMAHGFASSIIFAVAGIFMLPGHNWARILLLVWPLTALALTFIVSGLSLSLGLKTLTYGVLVLFLFRPAAVAYFLRMRADPNAA